MLQNNWSIKLKIKRYRILPKLKLIKKLIML
ncbi:Uncharacterised protein [Mycobacteroides abscessus subsp. abscessus]|nr:Uncharacterised protein [Mycobacteroides abscessus subsp. abscessus]